METNRQEALLEYTDQSSDRLNNPAIREIVLQQIGYLARRLPREKWRSVVIRYLGFNGQAESFEEIGPTHQNARQTFAMAIDRIKELYELPDRDWPLKSGEIQKYEDSIVTGLELALQQLPVALHRYAWRYYNLDGHGRLNTREMAEEFGAKQSSVLFYVAQVRTVVLEVLQSDQFVKDASQKLGLSRMSVDDLLFAFGDELRERLKGK